MRRLLLSVPLLHFAPACGAELRVLLSAWSERTGVAVQGLEHLEREEVDEEQLSGDWSAQLPSLLQRYNYLIVSGGTQRIERLVIIGAKGQRAATHRDQAVALQRDGLHHRVEAVLTGVDGRQVTTTLILDTGASHVVLPASMIESLGFRVQDLAKGSSQTASGSVSVRTATLAAVAVGDHEAREVAVSFVDDGRLGDLRLLGMSFLRRFRVTIDDEHQRLILVDR